MSAISLLREPAADVRLDGSGPEYRCDNRVWVQRVNRPCNCVVVRVEGELDAAVSGEFYHTVERALRTSCAAVVVDLQATRFLSLRVAMRLGALRTGESGGPDLRIVAGGPGVERALEVTGVRSLFTHYSSVQMALEV
ncbi:STAS domain-containing protein [Nocardia sp. CNY236]|uniref:STAS domain-containing protein n=1 Tax=Nocardia sp. CNY236 TaxID=1169152 RepID=UPI00048AB1D7|nr:STAS domain-containing protein [Nocardia sp. CNY236]